MRRSNIVARTCLNDYSIMRHPEMFKFAPTRPNMSQDVAISRNMVAKHTEHVAFNNIAICCIEMLQSFGRGLIDNPVSLIVLQTLLHSLWMILNLPTSVKFTSVLCNFRRQYTTSQACILLQLLIVSK